jgi:hypothetical protein
MEGLAAFLIGYRPSNFMRILFNRTHMEDNVSTLNGRTSILLLFLVVLVAKPSWPGVPTQNTV